jgi:RNA polymerase-associated protein RTF1
VKKARKPAKRAAPKPRGRRKAVEKEEEKQEEDIEIDDGYGSDLYGDDEDRRMLAAMTDVQRENILYERGENRRRLKEQAEARRKFREAQQAEQADEEEEEEKPKAGRGTRSARHSAKAKAESAIADLTVSILSFCVC